MPASPLRFAVLVGLLASTAFAQRDLKNIPDPDPELERKTFVLPEGFEVNLFAADPLLAKPIQINFDADGRLWVASSEVYPQIAPGQTANDKILVLEDQDHDGVADKTTVFADGLLIPTGVIAGDGGAYVANSTELIHLQDTNGDGRADRRRIVLTGFGAEDTHHILHTLRWGHDGCLYMNQSIYIHSHIETPHGVVRLNGGGIWRFRPETMRLEVFCKGFVNTWGHQFDFWGQSFATDGAYGEGINYVFPGAVFVASPDAKRRVVGLNPGSPKHCGLEILSGRHLPPSWTGSMITNDFRAHRVCRFVVSEDGSGYASKQEVELIKSSHPAFRPIDVKMGPDGAIYIADWYNPIIQHGEVDFRDPRRDHVHGRIWRVTAKGRDLLPVRKLTSLSTTELLNELSSPEDWVRLHAKLILKSRGEAELPAVREWLAARTEEHDRLETLWLFQSLDVVNEPLLRELLASKDHRVRAAAMRVVSTWRERLPDALALASAGVRDPHPRVRLEAVRALAAMPSLAAAEAAITALDFKPLDQFLDFAVWQAMRDLEPYWLPAVRDGRTTFNGNVEHLTFALKAVDSPGVVQPLLKLIQENKVATDRVDGVVSLIASLGGAKELGAVFQLIVDEKSPLPADRRARLLDALVVGSQQQKNLKPDANLERLTPLLAGSDDALRAAAARAAGAWRLESQRATLTAWLTDDQRSETVRHAAIEGLASLGGPSSAESLGQLVRSNRPLPDRIRAVNALALLNDQQAANAAVELLGSLPANADPGDVVATLLGRKSGPAALTKALADSELTPDIAKVLLRRIRAGAVPSNELASAVQKAGKLQDAGWKLTPALVEELTQLVVSQGDAVRGEAIYRRRDMNCLKCHAIGGAGGQVGPDLVSLGATAQIDYLIDSLIEPNKKVKENYHAVLVQTDEGNIYSGIPVRQSPTELVLRDAEDRQFTIPVASIEVKKDTRSLMPDGLVDTLTRAELVDLVRFLSELGKVGGPYAVGKEPVVRRWKTLVWTPEAHQRLNRTSHDTAASDDPALTWTSVYSTVAGQLPVDELPRFQPHRDLDPVSFARVELDVTSPGKIRLLINSPTGLSFWLNGKPIPPESLGALDLPVGRNVLTVAVNREQRPTPLRIELADSPGSNAKVQFVGGK